jgi:hypothetical protein
VELHHRHRQYLPFDEASVQDPSKRLFYEDPLTFAIGVMGGGDVYVTSRFVYETSDDGLEARTYFRRRRVPLFVFPAPLIETAVWRDFYGNGLLEEKVRYVPYSEPGQAIGAALCAQVVVPAGQRRQITFSLCWDMPLVRYALPTCRLFSREAEKVVICDNNNNYYYNYYGLMAW